MSEITDEMPYLATRRGVSTVNPVPITGTWKVCALRKVEPVILNSMCSGYREGDVPGMRLRSERERNERWRPRTA